MKLNELQWDAFKLAVDRVGYEIGISIYSLNDSIDFKGETLKYGVNWGAYGTVSADEALVFAEKLQEAAKIAKMLTDLQITYTYSESGPEIDKDEYLKNVRAIKEMIKLDMPEMVIAVLNKMA